MEFGRQQRKEKNNSKATTVLCIVQQLCELSKYNPKLFTEVLPSRACCSQIASGTQVDASARGLGSTLTQTALGTGRLLCHKIGNPPGTQGWKGVKGFYE